ncbi:MAG: TspO/MBR family protein [Dokdonella sp.]
MHRWRSLLAFLVATFAAAALGSLSMPDAWYAALNKPSFNPPSWIFGPVWTVLYVLIAVAGWRVWKQAGGWCGALSLWLLQLVLNGLWTPLFFSMHRIDLALIDIVALVVVLIATIIAFFKRDRVASWMLVPYLSWVSFATLLTASIYRLNPAG